MELRQLEAFVAVAAELHFGRAAQHLHLSQPTLSELIQRLERELGTPLLTRTTRRVALTGAGSELLGRAKVILDELAAAKAAVRRIAAGDAGTVRVGITPPVAPVLGPHLRDALAVQAPDVVLDMQRMWLPNLETAVADGTIDVAITCGLVPDPDGVVGEVFCAEPLLVGLRPDHRLAGQTTVTLADLAHDVLGTPSQTLFPAWALCQQQALAAVQITPPTVTLDATDLTATAWTDQPGADWILLIASLISPHTPGVVRPVTPQQLVPFGLQWNPEQAQTAAVARFVRLALSIAPPPGWQTQPGHLRHRALGHLTTFTALGLAAKASQDLKACR
ncbi:MAG: LysR family transcriptional regulator [Actinomycetota bacterium]|nr:LysR family transcriptional regulator [Actinomycetota bacterium]